MIEHSVQSRIDEQHSRSFERNEFGTLVRSLNPAQEWKRVSKW